MLSFGTLLTVTLRFSGLSLSISNDSANETREEDKTTLGQLCSLLAKLNYA